MDRTHKVEISALALSDALSEMSVRRSELSSQGVTGIPDVSGSFNRLGHGQETHFLMPIHAVFPGWLTETLYHFHRLSCSPSEFLDISSRNLVLATEWVNLMKHGSISSLELCRQEYDDPHEYHDEFQAARSSIT